MLLIALACCLLRSNGFIAVIVTMAIFVFAVSHDFGKYLGGLTACVALLYCVITGPIYSFANVVPAHFSEAIGVPLQQIGKAIHDGEDISEEDQVFLAQILPLESWGSLYDSSSPNYIKFAPDFNDEFLESNKASFVCSWVRVGINNPGTYVKAWIDQTKDYWSLKSHTWYVVGSGLGDFAIRDNVDLGFSWPISEAFLNDALNLAVSAFPHLYSIGSLAWLMVLCFFIAVIKKRCSGAIFCIPFIILWATFLLAAPASDFRYMFALHLAIPLFLLFGFCDLKPRNSIDLHADKDLKIRLSLNW